MSKTSKTAQILLWLSPLSAQNTINTTEAFLLRQTAAKYNVTKISHKRLLSVYAEIQSVLLTENKQCDTAPSYLNTYAESSCLTISQDNLLTKCWEGCFTTRSITKLWVQCQLTFLNSS